MGCTACGADYLAGERRTATPNTQDLGDLVREALHRAQSTRPLGHKIIDGELVPIEHLAVGCVVEVR